MFPSGFGYEKSNDGARTPKSERYFWLNSDFIDGNLKYKKRENQFLKINSPIA